VPATVNPRPQTVRPGSFNQAQEIADRYKDGQPVIMNLEGVDRDTSRRLIDFASGLCYGLGGAMEKVGSGVYLLTPVNASVSAEERRMMSEQDE
jgi:cell division inhibitor SepF